VAQIANKMGLIMTDNVSVYSRTGGKAPFVLTLCTICAKRLLHSPTTFILLEPEEMTVGLDEPKSGTEKKIPTFHRTNPNISSNTDVPFLSINIFHFD
jgi:hypothetical protein